jgi:hypothetical protein
VPSVRLLARWIPLTMWPPWVAFRCTFARASQTEIASGYGSMSIRAIASCLLTCCSSAIRAQAIAPIFAAHQVQGPAWRAFSARFLVGSSSSSAPVILLGCFLTVSPLWCRPYGHQRVQSRSKTSDRVGIRAAPVLADIKQESIAEQLVSPSRPLAAMSPSRSLPALAELSAIETRRPKIHWFWKITVFHSSSG